MLREEQPASPFEVARKAVEMESCVQDDIRPSLPLLMTLDQLPETFTSNSCFQAGANTRFWRARYHHSVSSKPISGINLISPRSIPFE